MGRFGSDQFGISTAAVGWHCLVLACLLAGLVATPRWARAEQPGVDHSREVRLGVLAYRDQWTTLSRWQATADYLAERMPGHRFIVAVYDHAGLRNALADQQLDFVLTNTGHYIELKEAYGVVPVATLVNRFDQRPLTRFGATIFTRADRADIASAADLYGRRFAATGPEAFGGFQMAWRELRVHGVDPFRDFKMLQLTGLPQDQVVLSVRDGLADAGTVRTGVLERMAQEGRIELAEFKILNARNDDGFPYLHSTDLYPEWPLSRAAHTPAALAKGVAEALFALEPGSGPARAARVSGWTVPLDYGAAEAMMRELHVGPFANASDWLVGLGRFAIWLGIGLVVPLAALAWFMGRESAPVRTPDD